LGISYVKKEKVVKNNSETADTRRRTQTKLNVMTFNLTLLFAWRPARQKIVIPLRGIKIVTKTRSLRVLQEKYCEEFYN
jgi:hypothetical protein